MRPWTPGMICLSLALITYSQSSFAGLDSQNGPPPCGADDICNFAVCNKDPDCPKEFQDKTPPVVLPDRPSDIIDCTAREVTEIGMAIDWGAENWNEYEAVLEDIRGWPVDIGSCLENRFKDNGKVVCEESQRGSCTVKGEDASGWGWWHERKCHMCPSFLDAVRALSGVANRQACYFALVTHEWGHTCWRGHKTLEIIDDEAFDFWKSKHPGEVTISYGACPLG